MRTSSTFGDPYPILHVLWRSHQSLVEHDFLGLKALLLWSSDLGALKSVVLEQALLEATVGEFHLTVSVLNASDPLTLVARAVFPVHLTVAMSLIIFVTPAIVIARLPREHSHSILFIIFVISFIHVALLVT